jgi:hypothetical protein
MLKWHIVMAWRIHNSVIRGEVDNRQRGIVQGKLWLKGCKKPVVLKLKGNACADLAGCLLKFENPGEVVSMPVDGKMAPIQQGSIGDLTASRKVRVLDIPTADAHDRLKKNRPVPGHISNCLYLEWYSEANGRVVIESPEYKLTISPPAWRLSPGEEQQRQKDSAFGFSGFMRKVSDALAAKKHSPPQDKEWDEFDYEKFMRECDARTDKFGELLDKYRDHPDRDRIIAKEMGWTRREEALEREKDAKDTPERETDFPNEQDERGFQVPDDLPDLQPDPATEGVDWIRDEFGEPTHPLSERALQGCIALDQKYEQLGLDQTEDADLVAFLGEYQTTAAKLAGALDDLAYGYDLHDGPFTVAYLKRALGHLHAAQAALEKVSAKKLLPAKFIDVNRNELFAIREETLSLMRRFRGKGQF